MIVCILAKANALLVAVLLSVNVNDPNTTTVVREFKKDITVKVSGMGAFSIFMRVLKLLNCNTAISINVVLEQS